MHKGLVGFAKYSILILTFVALAFVAIINTGVVSATHTSSAELQPEWSAAGQNVDYTVTLCNDVNSADEIDEVRVYKNEDYTDFVADPKTGWYLGSYNPVKGYYPYTATSSEYYIDPDECTDFTFSATVPSQPSDVCDLQWKFETRDVTETWLAIYDTTSIDSNAPTITKQVIGPQQGLCPPGQGEECWVMDHVTEIDIQVSDVSGEECDSGIDYCEFTITLDGSFYDSWTEEAVEGEVHETIIFEEDSVHVLNVTCVDIAGNVVEDIEVFRVDSTPPETTKIVSDPKKIVPIPGSPYFIEWVDSVTEITLSSVDPDPTKEGCNIGVKELYWANVIVDDIHCWEPDNPDFCDPVDVQMNMVEDDHVVIQKKEESCHLLQYYAVDELGNTEEIKTNCFFVDKTPPEVDKEVGEPKIEELDLEELGNGKAGWVTSQSYSGDSSAKLVIPDNSAGTDFAGVDSFFDVFVQLDQVTSLSYYRKVTQFDNGWNPIVILGIDADGDGVFEAQPLEWEAGSIPRNPALLGDDSFIQCEATTGLSGTDTDFVHVDATTFNCYTPKVDGTDWYWGVYQPLSYFQSNNVEKIETTDKVAMVKIKIGGNPSTQDNEVAYVDTVELNGIVRIDEPVGFTWVTPDSDITFTCTDQGPHPSDSEELCFKVSYDKPSYPTYITSDYCSSGTMEDGWCCVDARPNDPFVFNFNTDEDSFHDLEYYCRDAVEKESDVYIQYYKVDDTSPGITKEMLGTENVDWIGDCPPKDESDVCYVADNDNGGFKITATDGGDICHVDNLDCNVEVWWETSEEECTEPYGPYENGWCRVYAAFFNENDVVNYYFQEDSNHKVVVNCEDGLENEMIEDLEEFLVDSTPPETTKVYGEPYKAEPFCAGEICSGDEECIHATCAQWITGETPITLTAEDAKVGVWKIMYGDTIVPDEACYMPSQNCHPVEMQMTEVLSDEITFYKEDEESCHVIQYYAVDELGNTELIKYQCVFVDNTPPEGMKEVGEPNIPCVEGECQEFDYWVRDPTVAEPTLITLDCEDQGDHPVEQETMCYRVSFDDIETPWLTEDYCNEFGGEMTGVEIDDWCCVYVGDDEGDNYYEFYFMEDSLHDLEFYCIDHLGNTEAEVDLEWFKVDSIPPVTTKTYVPEAYVDPASGFEYIDTTHQIELTAVDGGDICHVDGVTTYYRYATVSDDMCEDNCYQIQWNEAPAWNTYSGPFGIPDESCHYIEFYSEDALGNKEELKYQCVFVDKKPPITTKWYEGPQYIDGSEYYFQTTTGDQAVNVTVEGKNNEVTWTVDFPIDDDTCNGLMAVGLIIATDGEGNGPAFQIHNNDGTDSSYNWGTWLMSPWGPTISDGWFGWHSGDTNTPVTDLDWVSAKGGRYREGKPHCPEPNPEGIFTITIDKSELGEDFHWALYTAIGSGFCSHAYQQATYPNDFGWGEPIVSSTNYVYVESVKGEYPKWITSETEVWLDADDPEPHPSGVAATWYRDVYLEDESDWHYCYEDCYNWKKDERYSAYGLPTAPEPYNPKSVDPSWEEWTGTPFYKTPESCHIIEYYSYDNVGKVERPKWQCVFVDNTAPEPDKKVGEPKEEWDGSDSRYYDIEDLCWNTDVDPKCSDPEKCLECWKVTLLTPIYLDCIDYGDHPVDHETVCFHVERDGKNETGEYCINGGELVYDEEYEKEFCCMENKEFNFGKTSEHELEYYCLDALGNKGETLDIEKFKVEETAFNITLNHKWNLISVPVFLLNDDPEAVFSEIADKVKGVWTYDSEGNWHAWIPGPAGDDLNTIEPGWGYWVLMEDDAILTIGGSLMRPGPVGQASKEIVPGWNLIGYYGADGETVYDKPDGDGGDAYCELYSLGEDIWDKEFTALLTYWEPDNPDTWYELTRYDEMDPGAGYWLATPQSGLYTPSTDCLWWD